MNSRESDAAQDKGAGFGLAAGVVAAVDLMNVDYDARRIYLLRRHPSGGEKQIREPGH